jgi:hypothetical protein
MMNLDDIFFLDFSSDSNMDDWRSGDIDLLAFSAACDALPTALSVLMSLVTVELECFTFLGELDGRIISDKYLLCNTNICWGLNLQILNLHLV